VSEVDSLSRLSPPGSVFALLTDANLAKINYRNEHDKADKRKEHVRCNFSELAATLDSIFSVLLSKLIIFTAVLLKSVPFRIMTVLFPYTDVTLQ